METPFVLTGGLAAIVLCAVAAKRFELSYPIGIVPGGSTIAFIPGVPVITIDPRYIFLIVLPRCS